MPELQCVQCGKYPGDIDHYTKDNPDAHGFVYPQGTNPLEIGEREDAEAYIHWLASFASSFAGHMNDESEFMAEQAWLAALKYSRR